MAEAFLEAEAVRLTSELIRIDTTNRGGGDCRERPAAEYVSEQLEQAGVAAQLVEGWPGRSNVLARIPGADPTRPALLVHGHLDVVPAEPAQWRQHPFSGDVIDGELWGRGALDMKSMVAMTLAVVRGWSRTGTAPQRDVVLAFTADEEDSAEAGARWLVQQHPEHFAGCTEGISESGGFTFHSDDGVRLYPVGAGERGTAWLTLTAQGTAGHGSRVNPDNAVGALAAAVARIDAYQWPLRLTPTVRAALAAIGAAVAAPGTPELGNLDDGFDVDGFVARLGPARRLVESTLRNSANPTMLAAGYKVNVVPGSATAGIDGRVLPGGEDEFRAVLDELTGPRVSWEYAHSSPPLAAPVQAPVFGAMRDALLAEDPDGHVVPVCLSGGTDAKHFARLGIAGYGFSPLGLPPGFDHYPLVHGVDERVPITALHFGARVLDRFLTTVQ